MSDISLAEFPYDGLLPKLETGAKEFLVKNPSYDGRGIVIAILDTGVDPAAVGLQETTDGKPKIIDIVDCTGAGDVILKEENDVPFPSDELITGLSGRQLKISRTWGVPEGTKIRRGMICLYDVFARTLVNRLSELRKERFMEAHSLLMASEQRKFDDWKRRNPAANTAELSLLKKDFEDRLAMLREFEKKFKDHGPIVDFVVYADPKAPDTFRAVFDLDGSGDLSAAVSMADYARERQHQTLDDDSLLSFSVKFYDGGRVLSFVTHCGSHGTHVAAITAANVPSNPAVNGLAPGAQIVSIKIGDARLRSFDTGIGVARAIKVIVENGCHLVNMSYGEESGIDNYGFFVVEMMRIAMDLGVVFVSCAGNSGPCLTTLWTPGGTSDCAIGVGAYVSQAMMEAQYSLLERNENMSYSWSSRGPTKDGDIGVHVYAPGGAVTSMPKSTLHPTELMNGTSMASPNVCGSIALLLSALRQMGKKWSFPRIKRIIASSAKSIGDPLGAGLLNVQAAFDLLQKTASYSPLDFYYNVTVFECDNGRGIYLRSHADFSKGQYFNCSVIPLFKKTEDNQRKFDLECHLSLVASKPWIRVPENLHFANKDNFFAVFVDLPALEEGANFGVVSAFDPKCKSVPLFTIPVVAIKPKEVSNLLFESLFSVKNGQLNRVFLNVPRLATLCKVKVQNVSDEKGVDRIPMVVVQALQVSKLQRISSTSVTKFTKLEASGSLEFTMGLTPNETLEICAGLSWAAHGTCDLKMTVAFDGVFSASTGFSPVLGSSCDYVQFDLQAAARKKTCKPKVSCVALAKVLSPGKPGVLSCSDERGIFTHNACKLFHLTLDYTLKNSMGESDVEFSLRALDESVYDSALSGVLMQVFEAETKRRLCTLDTYNRKIKALAKGSYDVRLLLVSPNKEPLLALNSMPVDVFFTSLPKLKDLSGSFYGCAQDMIRRSDKIESVSLTSSHARPLFLEVSRDLPDASPGDRLVFEVKFVDEKSCSDSPPIHFTLSKVVGGADPKEPEDMTAEKPFELKMLCAITEAAGKKPSAEDFAFVKKVAGNLFAEVPGWLLCVLKNTTESSDRLELCDKILGLINLKELLDFEAGRRTAENSLLLKSQAARHQETKALLVEALSTKLRILRDTPHSDPQVFDSTFQTLSSVAAVEERHLVDVFVAAEGRKGRLGSALKALCKCISESPACDEAFSYGASLKQLLELKIDLLRQLQWSPWIAHEEHWLLATVLPDYMPF